MQRRTGKAILVLMASLLCGLSAESVAEPFVLDFGPKGTGYTSNFSWHGGGTVNNQTPFLVQDVPVSTGVGTQYIQLPEIVTGPDGNSYYHIVVGDPNAGFAQETYIQRGFTSFPNSQVGSASGAGQSNASAPLDSSNSNSLSGNASGNPTRVVIRQLLNDGETSQEFYKGELGLKPKITQITNAPDIYMYTDIDMTNSAGYSDMTTAGMMTNYLSLPTTSQVPQSAGDYLMQFDGVSSNITAGGRAAQQQNSSINAGRYTYTAGVGPGGAFGTYTYADGGMDINAIDWELFFDPAQDNPWSYPENQPE